MRKGLLAIAVALTLPSCAYAQPAGVSDSVQLRNRCRLAVQIITSGHPEPHTEWAYEYVRRCGREGATATAHAMVAAAGNTDRETWEKLTTPAFYVRDAGIFESALRVAQDESASTTARVYSMKVLILTLSPGRTLSYDELTRGPTAQRVCFGTGPGSHHDVHEVSPIPSDYRRRISAAVDQMSKDPAEENAIRQAAACVAAHVRM